MDIMKLTIASLSCGCPFKVLSECEGNNTEGFENNSDAPSYYVRLGSLSSKVRDRTYQRAVDKVCNDMQCSPDLC